jgi:pimeloyl-ACP methyl ester carboxylesterase
MNNLFISSLTNAGKAYQLWADAWSRSGWRVQEHVLTGKARVMSPDGKIKFLGNPEECLRIVVATAPPANRRQAIIILHGMGRTARSFTALAAEFETAGFAVANVAYASLSATPDQNLNRLRRIITALIEDGAAEISFVGHSYGGMLIRRLLANPLPVPAGRVLMLGTPNQGSRFGQRLSLSSAYRIIFGPGGQAVLPTAARDVPVPDADIAVIAGGNGRCGYNPFLPGDNDGIVMVEEARLRGAQLRVMPCLHTFLPSQPAVRQAALGFIRTGQLS